MIVVPSWIWPLQRAYRNRDRASRCLREPVGCVDSSLRYRSTSGNDHSGTRTRCVSADLLPSASTRRTASCTQARSATEVRSTSPTRVTLSGVMDMPESFRLRRSVERTLVRGHGEWNGDDLARPPRLTFPPMRPDLQHGSRATRPLWLGASWRGIDVGSKMLTRTRGLLR